MKIHASVSAWMKLTSTIFNEKDSQAFDRLIGRTFTNNVTFEDPKVIILCGGPATGKTTLLHLISEILEEAGAYVKWYGDLLIWGNVYILATNKWWWLELAPAFREMLPTNISNIEVVNMTGERVTFEEYKRIVEDILADKASMIKYFCTVAANA